MLRIFATGYGKMEIFTLLYYHCQDVSRRPTFILLVSKNSHVMYALVFVRQATEQAGHETLRTRKTDSTRDS